MEINKIKPKKMLILKCPLNFKKKSLKSMVLNGFHLMLIKFSPQIEIQFSPIIMEHLN